jgi:hypothetical protein
MISARCTGRSQDAGINQRRTAELTGQSQSEVSSPVDGVHLAKVRDLTRRLGETGDAYGSDPEVSCVGDAAAGCVRHRAGQAGARTPAPMADRHLVMGTYSSSRRSATPHPAAQHQPQLQRPVAPAVRQARRQRIRPRRRRPRSQRRSRCPHRPRRPAAPAHHLRQRLRLRTRLGLFFETRHWIGEPANREPDKFSAIG